MKPKKGIMVVMLLFITWGAFGQSLPMDELPRGIASFVHTHFPDQEITHAVVMEHPTYHVYNLVLDHGAVHLEFNEDSEVTAITSDTRIPDSALPLNILNFLNEKYPGRHAVEWEWHREDQNHLVLLDDETLLEFNSRGEFVGEDRGIR